jgi:hypothetical protein
MNVPVPVLLQNFFSVVEFTVPRTGTNVYYTVPTCLSHEKHSLDLIMLKHKRLIQRRLCFEQKI